MNKDLVQLSPLSSGIYIKNQTDVFVRLRVFDIPSQALNSVHKTLLRLIFQALFLMFDLLVINFPLCLMYYLSIRTDNKKRTALVTD